MPQERKKINEWVLNKLHITRKPTVRVYNGYGDQDMLLVFGHVLRQSPLSQKKFKKNFWSNSMALLRLFMVEPFRRVKVELRWSDTVLESVSDEDGFFKFEWKLPEEPQPGWHSIVVTVASGKHRGVQGEGKVLVPYPTQYAFISDIDDTFLISHSSSLRKRLYVLLTKNARTRKPFEGVVHHYQLLAKAGTTAEVPNPFFYVSSSEWNLYDYIGEFNRSYGLPEGVYLLSQMKSGWEMFRTGQTKHNGKFTRIARILKEFPHQKFILLGDDTQKDAEIYARLAAASPEQILCIFLRQVGKNPKLSVGTFLKRIASLGISVCYFKRSEEAIAHSHSIGLIENPVYE